MSPAPGQQNAPNRGLATAAGQAGAQIDAVFQLEEATHPVGIHVVGNGRTAQPDRMLKNLAQGEPEPFKFGLGGRPAIRRGRMPA
jgi:hypothetical protein